MIPSINDLLKKYQGKEIKITTTFYDAKTTEKEEIAYCYSVIEDNNTIVFINDSNKTITIIPLAFERDCLKGCAPNKTANVITIEIAK